MLTDWAGGTLAEAWPDSLGFLFLSVGKAPSERRVLSPSRQGRLEKGREDGFGQEVFCACGLLLWFLWTANS